MHISFERFGGVGGFRLTTEIDTDQLQVTYGAARVRRVLSPDEAHSLERLVESASFFTLPGATAPGTRSADRFQHVITVESAGRRHSVRTTDEVAPEALRVLLSSLTRIAMGREASSGSRGTPKDSDC